VGPRSNPDTVRAAADRLRGKYRAKPKQQKRMSGLLAKGNAGTLSAKESLELDRLVEDFERRAVAMAEELAATYGVVASKAESETAR
jgi:hypothetical protein